MKFKIIYIALFLISFNVFAQDYKIIYQFNWKSQTTDNDENSELTALIKKGDDSYFSSFDNFQQDSLTTKVVNDFLKKGDGQLRIPDLNNNSKFSSVIMKNIKNQNYVVEDKIYDKLYLTKYDCKQNWKILPDKTNILGYRVQKAETIFGGRKWIAWFTNQIPLSDGPYKFYGLPGLILKISDSENNFVFEVKGLTKQNADISQRNFIYNKVELNPKQWNIFWEKYKKEPSMIFANLNNENTTYVINGQNVEEKGVKESYNKREWERINYFKNPIELENCGYR